MRQLVETKDLTFTFYKRDSHGNDILIKARIPNAIVYLETDDQIIINRQPLNFTKCEIKEFDKIELSRIEEA